MDVRDERRMELQNREFDALTALADEWAKLRNIAVVDDDYPRARRIYETKMQDLIDATDANGRRARKKDYRNDFPHIMWPDLRRIHAQRFVAEILHIVETHLNDEDRRRRVIRILAEELFDAAWKAGVHVLTDGDRQAAGLPPRGPFGWTDDELRALEDKRLENLRRPVMVLAPNASTDPQAQFIPPTMLKPKG
jgi:hypothetical protein